MRYSRLAAAALLLGALVLARSEHVAQAGEKATSFKKPNAEGVTT